MPSAAQPVGGITAAVRDARAFRRYWLAMGTSTIGSGVTLVAVPLLALTVLDASPFQVAMLTAAGYVANVLIGLPAGLIVQALPLRALQVAMDVIRAVAVLSIPVAAALSVLSFVQLLLVALVVGLASVIFEIANATFLPTIVSPEQLTAKNSMLAGTHTTTQLIGPAVGGLFVQLLGAAATMVIDGISYLLSALLLRGIVAAPQAMPAKYRKSTRLSQIGEGLAFVVNNPVIRWCVVAATAANLAAGWILAVSTVFLVRTLGLPPAVVGVLLAFDAAGGVLAAAFTARWVRRFGSARTIVMATVLGAVLTLLMPALVSTWGALTFAVGSLGLGGGVTVLSIVTRTHRQLVTPGPLLSRVVASVRFISWASIPIGALVAGQVATSAGVRMSLAVGCALLWLTPLSLVLGRIHRSRDLSDQVGVASPAP